MAYKPPEERKVDALQSIDVMLGCIMAFIAVLTLLAFIALNHFW